MAESTVLDAMAYRPPEFSTGTLTSWIPLITPYSMYATDCTSAFWRWRPEGTPVAWDPGYGISVDPNLRCVPEAVTTWWDQNWLGSNSETVVSIGPLTCPDPFTTAATISEDASRTRVACCPSEFTFSSWRQAGTIGECFSRVDPGVVITFQTRNSNKEWSPTTTTFNSSARVLAVQINGWIFAEETGTPSSSTASTPSSSTASGTSSCSSHNGALYNSNMIGIGVGVGMGVAGLMALAAGVFMMRRSRKVQRPTRASMEQHMQADPPMQETYALPSGHIRTELHGGHGMAVENRYKAQPSELPDHY
ncbi:hypothetical protein KVR01_007345 [Diaporthe batatas]|uniref:uncharacterized protein n=1 Tax=Diaporthe batatas TaxID=748121 RepID=UPI001D03F847|nr:uncharacterized protein KVR01_007345 [Diaporthe batatas]KAG8162867.1 hypothetical protein KVR01_007345 [Diaporthe batatas]